MPGFDNLMLSNVWDKPKVVSKSTLTGAYADPKRYLPSRKRAAVKHVFALVKWAVMVKSFNSTLTMSSNTNANMRNASRWVKSRGRLDTLSSGASGVAEAGGGTVADSGCRLAYGASISGCCGLANRASAFKWPDVFKWAINMPLEA